MTTVPLAQARPGDIVACETKSTFGRLIGFGQWLRRADRSARRFHHIGVLVTPGATERTAEVVQAARRVDVATVAEAAGGGAYVVVSCPPGVDRAKVVAQARACVGERYGVLSIVSIVVSLLAPKGVTFRRPGTWICSALGAWSLHAGGWLGLNGAGDVYSITPAELVEALTAGD